MTEPEHVAEPDSSHFGGGIKADGPQVTFLECSNQADDSVEGVVTRTVFTGHFAIDGYQLRFNEDDRLVEAGLGADFDEYNGPTRAWVWFSAPVNDAVKEVFENFFSSTFDDDRLHMEVDPDVFVTFADSNAWGAFDDENNGESSPSEDNPMHLLYEEEDDLSAFLSEF